MDGFKPPPSGPLDEKAQPAAAPEWVGMRDKLVQQALNDDDLPSLRRISILPGGYGSEESRERVWPRLLQTRRYFEDPTEDSPERKVESDAGPSHARQPSIALDDAALPPHPDETQVGLDTRRSFVTYPRGIPKESKMTMQAELHLLIVQILRKYPTLSYFQGFHDIMSALYLTFIPLPPPPQPRSRSASTRGRIRSREASRANSRASSPARHNGIILEEGGSRSTSISRDVSRSSSPGRAGMRSVRDVTALPGWKPLLECAEVLAVCTVRDAMGKSMDPMMGLLKILKRLLQAADPQLDRFSSSISPVPTLPFFALSWILCLFSHDIDTLEPVQRMFDFLLARNPISAIYLAVAILMAKKKQMFALAKALGSEAQDDPSLLHPLFARLPPLYPDTPEQPLPPSTEKVSEKLDPSDDEPNPYDSIPLSRIFSMTDDLLARYPWDGPLIRGREIMGPHSVVCTYDQEYTEHLSLEVAQKLAEGEVILPGATEPDEEPVLPPIRRIRRPNRIGTIMAVGVVVLGVGIALHGFKAESRSGWRGWWAAVVGSWVRSRQWIHGLDVDVLSLLRQRMQRLA